MLKFDHNRVQQYLKWYDSLSQDRKQIEDLRARTVHERIIASINDLQKWIDEQPDPLAAIYKR